jgi:hypothetical protein
MIRLLILPKRSHTNLVLAKKVGENIFMPSHFDRTDKDFCVRPQITASGTAQTLYRYTDSSLLTSLYCTINVYWLSLQFLMAFAGLALKSNKKEGDLPSNNFVRSSPYKKENSTYSTHLY